VTEVPPAPRETILARALVELADTLVDDFDVAELLSRVVDRCVGVLGMSAAGLMLVGPSGQLGLAASSNEAVRLVELFQLQSQEGPCLDCYRTGQPVVNHDLGAVERRWLNFAPVAVERGFRSVHALPLRLRGHIIGALNLFGADDGQMDTVDVQAAQSLADMATIAILQHRSMLEAHLLNEQLSVALNSRVMIEQAKGVLSERSGVDMDAAFSLLRSYARSHNLKLTDVAQQVSDRTLPDDALAPPSNPDGRSPRS